MSLLDILYPKHCPVCLDILPPGKKLICDPCRKKIAYVKEPYCLKCGRPMTQEWEEYCQNCKKRFPSFERGLVWAQYSSKAIRTMLSQVKYHEDPQLLDFPCLDFAERCKDMVAGFHAECLIPVPVHKSRLKERGYNQAEEIADRLGKVLHLPVDPSYLIREKKTAAQKTLNDYERILNLQKVFRVDGPRAKYETVILVDDILTTGATAEACTWVLKSAGVKKVYFMALAAGWGG